MTDAPDNPAAFPRTGEGLGNPMYDAPGMTLRDWFAGQALAGFSAAVGRAYGRVGETAAQADARGSYERADAMIAARKAKP